MKLPLQLRQSKVVAGEASAWFLLGASTARWLEELARCGLANAETRLFAVPKSVRDRTPAGLLVVPARPESSAQGLAGLACRLVAERLFVPIDAVLHPPLSDADVRALCSGPICFFHPTLGLSSFDAESTLRIWDLLKPPPERTENWNGARPGAPALPPLRAIVLAQPPSLNDLFGGADNEIATETPVDLPPSADEPKQDPLAHSHRRLRLWLAKGLAGAIHQIPHIGTRRTWLNDVEDWAHRQLQGVGEQFQRLRHKELHRLLRLFDTDPESALRHAIPMNAFAHRGLAPPGARLGGRSPNLDLNRLGGRAADFWEVPWDLQETLRQRYRQMANREMELGRYRRAAYIYAELLGDLFSAANVLKQGNHFREAALLYEEHLNNPLEAARCLAQAGLLPEAIERYEKLGLWLEVADLHERLGNRPAAEETLRRLISECLAQDDLLAAAKLTEERLHAPDEALTLLLSAWPASRQAVTCLERAFQMLARLGRHEVALETLAHLSHQTPPPVVLPLLTALAGPARDYPHFAVRHHAADFSRRLIARELSELNLPADTAGRLMESLARLAPQDRLLARDANRYLASCRDSENRRRCLTPPPRPGNQPVLVHQLELPRQIEWLRLQNEWHWFYAAGVTARRLTLVRGIWDGELQSLSWVCSTQVAKTGLLFEPTGERGRAVVLHLPGTTDFTQKVFPAADMFFGTECLAGTPAWLDRQHGPMSFGEECVWTAQVAAGRAILSRHDKTGRLQHTLDVTEDLLAGAERTQETRLCLAAVGNNVAVGLGNRLVVTRNGGGPVRVPLSGQVRGLVATPPHTRAGLALLLNQGAAFHWLGTTTLIDLDRDVAAHHAAFVPGGPLVLLSEKHAVLFDVDSRGVQKVTRMPLVGPRPVGLSSTGNPGQFAILNSQGTMTVYRVPL